DMTEVDLTGVIGRGTASGAAIDGAPVGEGTSGERLSVRRDRAGVRQVIQVRRPDEVLRRHADVGDAKTIAAAKIAIDRERELMRVRIVPVDIVRCSEVRL